MTNKEEVIEHLLLLKESAVKSHNDTGIINVKLDSFNFVMDMAIKALEQQSMPTMVYPQVEGITPVVVEPIPKLPPVNQQEPCEDVISRQGDDRWLIHFGQNMAIPSAEPKWIPVSERLPEYTDDYTVTVGINNGNRMYYAVRTALYQIRFNQWIVYESEKTLVGEVIAWQDSPEPYKAERE